MVSWLPPCMVSLKHMSPKAACFTWRVVPCITVVYTDMVIKNCTVMHSIIVLLFPWTELLQLNMISQLNNNLLLYFFFLYFLSWLYRNSGLFHHRDFQHISEQNTFLLNQKPTPHSCGACSPKMPKLCANTEPRVTHKDNLYLIKTARLYTFLSKTAACLDTVPQVCWAQGCLH